MLPSRSSISPAAEDGKSSSSTCVVPMKDRKVSQSIELRALSVQFLLLSFFRSDPCFLVLACLLPSFRSPYPQGLFETFQAFIGDNIS